MESREGNIPAKIPSIYTRLPARFTTLQQPVVSMSTEMLPPPPPDDPPAPLTTGLIVHGQRILLDLHGALDLRIRKRNESAVVPVVTRQDVKKVDQVYECGSGGGGDPGFYNVDSSRPAIPSGRPSNSLDYGGGDVHEFYSGDSSKPSILTGRLSPHYKHCGGDNEKSSNPTIQPSRLGNSLDCGGGDDSQFYSSNFAKPSILSGRPDYRLDPIQALIDALVPLASPEYLPGPSYSPGPSPISLMSYSADNSSDYNPPTALISSSVDSPLNTPKRPFASFPSPCASPTILTAYTSNNSFDSSPPTIVISDPIDAPSTPKRPSCISPGFVSSPGPSASPSSQTPNSSGSSSDSNSPSMIISSPENASSTPRSTRSSMKRKQYLPQLVRSHRKRKPELPSVRPVITDDGRFKILALKCVIEDCPLMLANEDHLARHLRECHNGAGIFRCAMGGCGVNFETRESLDSHIAIHTSLQRNFTCTDCHMTFITYADLATHRQNFHETGLFGCSFTTCIQLATTRSAILEHITTAHQSEQQLICNYCGKLFTGGTFKLRLHERTHSNVRPYQCRYPGCFGYAGTQKIHAIQHVRMVHFGLPASMKVQKERGLVDDRDPMMYVHIASDLL